MPGLHLGGRSTLALQGVRQNLVTRERLSLWGDKRFELPHWFTARFPAPYVWATLFNWPDDGQLQNETLTTPSGTTAGLSVSVPERATLEMLYDVGKHHGIEDAHELFENLRNVRKDHFGRLQACCGSVKVVRLFLKWARENDLVDVEELQRQYRLPIGSPRRWISRLKDGTLLTLKRHG